MKRMLETKDIQLIDLTEARKNPGMNPKVSAYEALEPYSKELDIHIHFSNIEKLGINPVSSQFPSGDTPAGIYAYPISQLWKIYNIDKHKTFSVLPYAGNFSYVWILEEDYSSNIIYDLHTDYDNIKYLRDYEKLSQFVLNNPNVLEKMILSYSNISDVPYDKNEPDLFVGDVLYQFSKMGEDHPAHHLWHTVKGVASLLKGSPLVQWNVLLRKVLGYDGLCDRSGRGYIHHIEKMQSLFLHKKAFTVKKMFLNKDYL